MPKHTQKKPPADFWTIENACMEEGYRIVCGIDEAGRGPLAGPVFAAAVILPQGLLIDGLDDSKKLSEKKREALFDVIREKAAAFGIASADEREIDALNILNATMLAMHRALLALGATPDLALIDGNCARGFTIPTRCIIGGDGKSASIAAASILAKVSRDRLMRALDADYPQYGFAVHKGYGTRAHREAILQYGPCAIHRKSFLTKICAEDLR